MRISVCITVFNEFSNIELLIDSIRSQIKISDEIVIVDAGSSDGTIRKIRMYKDVKLIVYRGASIAMGRNAAVRNAKNSIIVMTDAGCICEKDWLAEMILPFEKSKIQVVAGFYKMSGDANFQIALKPFLGIMPENFDKRNFLPSTRSIAFRKSAWKEVGGFSEKFDRAGEDTDFNRKLVKNGFKIERVKKAIVNWEVPSSLVSSTKKFFSYARGDAQSGDYFTSHNIKVMTIFVRYILFLFLLLLSFVSVLSPMVFVIIFSLYLVWSVSKHARFVRGWKARTYTAIIQVVSDFAVMSGFIYGTWDILNR